MADLQNLLPSMSGMPGVPGVPGLSPIMPTGAPVAGPVGQSPFQSFLTGGFQVPKLVLTLLTIFPPTAIIGLNLSAVNNMVGTIIKGLSYGAGILWGMYFNRMYPSTIGNIISILMFIGPWYLFDIFTILDSKFLGFKPPIEIPGYPPLSGYPGVEKGESWRLSPALLGVIMTTIPAGIAGATGIANYYSPNAVSGDTQKYIGYATAGVGALVGGMSLYSMFQVPATAAPAPAPAPAPFPPQVGQGYPSFQGGGGPSLSQIAKTLTRKMDIKGETESQSFLGILGIVFIGGLALAVTRSKQAAKTSS